MKLKKGIYYSSSCQQMIGNLIRNLEASFKASWSFYQWFRKIFLRENIFFKKYPHIMKEKSSVNHSTLPEPYYLAFSDVLLYHQEKKRYVQWQPSPDSRSSSLRRSFVPSCSHLLPFLLFLDETFWELVTQRKHIRLYSTPTQAQRAQRGIRSEASLLSIHPKPVLCRGGWRSIFCPGCILACLSVCALREVHRQDYNQWRRKRRTVRDYKRNTSRMEWTTAIKKKLREDSKNSLKGKERFRFSKTFECGILDLERESGLLYHNQATNK